MQSSLPQAKPSESQSLGASLQSHNHIGCKQTKRGEFGGKEGKEKEIKGDLALQ